MSDTSSAIYNGLWFDYASGDRVLTLTGRKAAALQAATPLAIAFIGSQVWSIVRIVFYHLHFRRKAANSSARIEKFEGYLDQRRVILRNSSGGLTLFWELGQQVFRWRRFSKNTSAVPFHFGFATPAMMIFALAHFALWIIAGVLVGFMWTQPYVTQMGLLQGNLCGTLSIFDYQNRTQQILFETVNINQTEAGDQYVKQCYSDKPSAIAPCGYYPQPKLTFQTRDADCPFDVSNNCINKDSTPYEIDTGFIDSSETLGINAKPEDRVLFRKSMTCSPISSRGFVDIVNANETDKASLWPPDTRLYRFYYGGMPGDGTFNTSWTFEFSSWKPSDGYGYDLTSRGFFGGAASQTWNPNSTFWNANRTDADVAIFFLNGDHIVSNFPTSDPFFITGEGYTEPVNGQLISGVTPEFYTTVLACIDQYQICPGDKRREFCSAPSGIYHLGASVFDLGFNSAQLATAQRIVTLLSSLSTYGSVAGRSASSLLASLSVLETTQTRALPIDQWRHEVTQWFSISLAKLQQSVVDFAAGPPEPSLNQYVQRPQDPHMASQCGSQKIMLPSGAYNFQWKAIAIILAVGLPLWVLGTFLEYLIDLALKLCGANERRLYWIVDAPCQLQRLAYKAAGYGKWERGDRSLPVWALERPGIVPELDYANLKEPVLVPA